MTFFDVKPDAPTTEIVVGDIASNRWFSNHSLALWRFGLIVLFLLAWEITARSQTSDLFTGSPSGILGQLRRWSADGTLWSATRVTLVEAALGFVIGSVIGAIAGFFLGWYAFLGKVFEPFTIAFYAMPRIALAPVFVLWFGIGLTSKVVMAVTSVFFFVFFNTYQGVKTVDRDLVDITLVMGASRLKCLRVIGVPSAAIWVFTGLRMALPYALIGAVVGEFIAAQDGLGYLVKQSSEILNTNGVFAGLTVLVAAALISYAALGALEHRVLRWRDS